MVPGGVLNSVEDLSEATVLKSPYGDSIPAIVQTSLDPYSPRARCLKDTPNKEKKYELGYDSDGESGPW